MAATEKSYNLRPSGHRMRCGAFGSRDKTDSFQNVFW
jgi:hypothetical protein